MKILGKKTIYYYLSLIFLIPMWLLHIGKKKSWKELLIGAIPHKCEYDYDNPKYKDSKLSHFKCKHYGCNHVSIFDKHGKWCEFWN